MNFKSTVIILISLVQVLLFTQQVEAYCIYNKTNTKYVNLRQTSYHTTAPLLSLFLKSHVGPDSRECCPYTTTDCSSSKTKEEVLVMSIFVSRYHRYAITFPAGGWINIIDPHNSATDAQNTDVLDFEVFNADGSPFPYEHLSL